MLYTLWGTKVLPASRTTSLIANPATYKRKLRAVRLVNERLCDNSLLFYNERNANEWIHA